MYLTPLLRRVFRPEIVRYLRILQQTEWLSKEDIDRLQVSKLRKLLDYAGNTFPYYRELFAELNFDPRKVTSVNDLKVLPILTKDIIRRNWEKFLPEERIKKKLVLCHSGGSTGSPLTFYTDKDSYAKMEASMLRSFSWAGVKENDSIAFIWGAPQDLRIGRGKRSTFSNMKSYLSGRYYFNAYTYSDEVMGKWLKVMAEKRIHHIYGYASVVSNLAAFVERSSVKAPLIKGIFTSAETLFQEQREKIQKVFGCKVYDVYGSREVISIAVECPCGNMHVLTDFAHVEFVDGDLEKKKLIVTSLVNYGTPFIRYDIGDYAEPAEGECPCGRKFPLMKMGIGRINDNIVTPEGKMVYGTYFVRQLYGVQGITQYQYRQRNKEELDLYLVRENSSESNVDEVIGRLRETISSTVSPHLRLNVIFTDQIEPSPSGKHRYVISEVV